MKQNNTVKALTLFWHTFKSDMFLSLLGIVIVLIAAFGGFLPNMNYEGSNSFEIYNETNAMFALGFSLLSVFLVIKNFSFMYSAKKADSYFTLPLSRTAQFLARFLSSFTVAAIPAVLYYGLRMVFMLVDHEPVADILFGLLWTVTSMLAVSAFTILCMVLAGNFKNLFLVGFGLVVAEFMIGFVFNQMEGYFLEGWAYNESSILAMVAISPVSPIFTMFSDSFGFFSSFVSDISYHIFITAQLIFAFATIIVAILLFCKREAESYTRSFAFKKGYIFVSFIIALAGFACGFINIEQPVVVWILGSVFSMLFTLLFGLMVKKNKKELKTALLAGVAAVITAWVGILICISGGLGYTGYLPKKSQVESATLNYHNYRKITFNDSTELIALHKKIIDERPLIKVIDSKKTENLAITYKLKNGKEVQRKFAVELENFEDELYNCHTSEGYIETITNVSTDDIKSVYGYIGYETIPRIKKDDVKAIKEALLLDIKEYEKTKLYYFSDDWVKISILYYNQEQVNFSGYKGAHTRKVLDEIKERSEGRENNYITK